MKRLKEALKKAFNSNTGYFLNRVIYFWEGKSEVGYVLCRGYVMFGIPGFDRVGVYFDYDEALRDLQIWKGTVQ